MDQTPVARRQPDLDPDLAQLLRRYSARKLLEGFRAHCYREAQCAQQDGYTGLGWLELYDQIEEIMPSDTDEELCGNEVEQTLTLTPGQVFARSHAPGRW
jgi:hypothetical protein